MDVPLTPDKHNPTTNRLAISMPLVVDKLDAAEVKLHKSKAVRSTLRRPQVSATNPHKCDEHTKPIVEATYMKPCSVGVKCRSHLAAGNTNDMQLSSTMIDTQPMPVPINSIQ